jgi:hypothetical protein
MGRAGIFLGLWAENPGFYHIREVRHGNPQVVRGEGARLVLEARELATNERE